MSRGQGVFLKTEIRYAKGVGPARAAQLATLGIHTVEDLCYYAPFRYEDRTRFVTLRALAPGEVATVRGRVLAKSLRRLPGGRTIVEAAVGDASGVCRAVWFHQPYLAEQLTVGEELILYGRVENGRRPQLIHPELERVTGAQESSFHMGRIVPIYSVTEGIGQRWFRQLLGTVLGQLGEQVEETLPSEVRAATQWPTAAEAIHALHFPVSFDEAERARARLAFEELLVLQLALVRRRMTIARSSKPQRYQLTGPLTEGLRQQLPFSLTLSQQRVLEECLEDLSRASPMQRLLHGEVGCGKTAVIICLIAVAVQSGYQVAVMAPTELLAEQHVQVMSRFLTPLGVSIGLLSKGVSDRQRTEVVAAAARGELSVVIGTHALIERQVIFQRLALVVIDEQHKFGVAQRAHLAKKAVQPDVLVVTATPIPRTLALSLYGDLSISTIDQLPPGRRPVTTEWFQESQRRQLYDLIREELADGRQGYIVYPLVEAHEAQAMKAAASMARQLRDEVFPTFTVGLLHGQLSSREKDARMQAFARGEIQLLVSTVIVEVGLDVQNATVMVIEHPERFGLAQLHQLRGRIGRGSAPARCILLGEVEEPEASARLETFVSTNDGFLLAEKDLALRGPGELLGKRQHGMMRLRLAHLLTDQPLLEQARHLAEELIQRDAKLSDPELVPLRSRVDRLYRPQPLQSS